MRNFIWLFVIIFSLNACKTVKESTVEDNSEIINNCPNHADCDLKILNNSSLTIKEDTIGELYPVIEKGDGTVIKYKFTKKGPEGTVDGDYSESIHFKIPENTRKLNLKDEQLQEVNLLFGKHCFCKGEAGYYKVFKGELNILNNSKELVIDLSFVVDETTHEIKHLSQKIQL